MSVKAGCSLERPSPWWSHSLPAGLPVSYTELRLCLRVPPWRQADPRAALLDIPVCRIAIPPNPPRMMHKNKMVFISLYQFVEPLLFTAQNAEGCGRGHRYHNEDWVGQNSPGGGATEVKKTVRIASRVRGSWGEDTGFEWKLSSASLRHVSWNETPVCVGWE